MESNTKIKIKGQLDQHWKDWFDGMEIIHEEGATVLKGKIKDESTLYGIINKIRDLNLKLISLNSTE